MKRSKHSLSHYTLSTFDMGQLVPVGHYEVLPGDSIRQSTSCLLRVSPLMAPVMHPVTVRLHHWFVPYRVLLGDDWENFITGGSDGLGEGSALPKSGALAGVAAGSLGDYLGLPLGIAIAAPGVNIMPVQAYQLIVNEYYRDQDLQVELASDSLNQEPFNVAWEKDYFTSARPWTQKGPDVSMPLGIRAPVEGIGPIGGIAAQNGPVNVRETGGTGSVAYAKYWTPDQSPQAVGIEEDIAAPGFPGIWANLEGATAAAVNDVRLAFALQRYQEARAQYGSRYTEYLRYLGVRSSDARLQRPEYLGGGRTTINFSEVLRTGDDSSTADPDAPIGEMRGHGISALRSRRWVRFFEEHGIVMTLASVRPRSMYMDGVHRSWGKSTKEDYWQKELEQIGQQEIFNYEVYGAHPTPMGVFGYQDRYAEYRHERSYVTGDFRTTLSDWHMARIFGAPPALNSDFVQCVPSKRVHAVQTEDVLWGMFSHSIQARRLVGHKTIGRIF